MISNYYTQISDLMDVEPTSSKREQRFFTRYEVRKDKNFEQIVTTTFNCLVRSVGYM